MEKKGEVPDVLVRVIQAKLAVRFGDACVEFSRTTKSQPYKYLTATDNSWNLRRADRLIGLLTEYKPLTE